jgi:hypothetical protein
MTDDDTKPLDATERHNKIFAIIGEFQALQFRVLALQGMDPTMPLGEALRAAGLERR